MEDAPWPSAVPADPGVPASSEMVQEGPSIAGSLLGAGDGEGVADVVVVGVHEGVEPGLSDSEAVGVGDSVGHTARMTLHDAEAELTTNMPVVPAIQRVGLL